MAELIDEAKAAYLFLDEGGNFDFSRGGTKYFTLTSVLVSRPFKFDSPLTELRFDLIEAGLNKEYFHASEDEQNTRNSVFEIIAKSLNTLLVDSIVVEKRKAAPPLRDEAVFYPKMLGELLKYVGQTCRSAAMVGSDHYHRPDPREQKAESNREGDQDDAPADAS